MIYQVHKILEDVRVVLDENRADIQLAGFKDIDTLNLDHIIKSKILDSVRQVEMFAPSELLNSGYNMEDDVSWNDDGKTGWLVLPDNFMRLIAFKMSDWEQTVYQAIMPNNPKYKQQKSRWAGLRGNPQRPVCAIVMRPEGKCLEFFSCKNSDATIDQGVYLPYPFYDGNGVDICEQCYRAVIYNLAGMIKQTYEGSDAASYLFEQAKTLLSVNSE